MTNDMENGYPEPTTIRDLQLMYDTCGKYNGTIEYERTEGLPNYGLDYREGMVTCHAMAVTPMMNSGTVRVQVYREIVTDLRKDGTYRPHRDVLWEKTYPSFEEFHKSPFWEPTMDAWKGRGRWDTRPLDDHEAVDDGDRRWVWGHYYKHETDWLGNDRLSGEIGSVNVYVRDDGYISIDIDYDEVFSGMIQNLARMLKAYEDMKVKLERLKTHGVDLNDGTLSIKLWSNADE